MIPFELGINLSPPLVSCLDKAEKKLKSKAVKEALKRLEQDRAISSCSAVGPIDGIA